MILFCSKYKEMEYQGVCRVSDDIEIKNLYSALLFKLLNTLFLLKNFQVFI